MRHFMMWRKKRENTWNSCERAGCETEMISRGTHCTCELRVLTDSALLLFGCFCLLVETLTPPPSQLINQLLFLLCWIRNADAPRLSSHAVLVWTAMMQVISKERSSSVTTDIARLRRRQTELKSHLTIKYVKIVQIGNELKHFPLMFRSINWKKKKRDPTAALQ